MGIDKLIPCHIESGILQSQNIEFIHTEQMYREPSDNQVYAG
jgi:hypothetical protein